MARGLSSTTGSGSGTGAGPGPVDDGCLESNVDKEGALRNVVEDSFVCLAALKLRGVTKSVGMDTEGTTLATFVVCTRRTGVVTGLVKYVGSVFLQGRFSCSADARLYGVLHLLMLI